MTRFARALTVAAFLSAPFAAGAVAEESVSYKNLLTPVLSSSTTVIDQPIVYPEGTPKITAAVVVIPPGGETGWHLHKVPLFAYVLEGEVTVDYGEKGVKVVKAGEGILEGIDWPHVGMNKTDQPLHILAVYIGAEGIPNAEAVAAPR